VRVFPKQHKPPPGGFHPLQCLRSHVQVLPTSVSDPDGHQSRGRKLDKGRPQAGHCRGIDNHGVVSLPQFPTQTAQGVRLEEIPWVRWALPRGEDVKSANLPGLHHISQGGAADQHRGESRGPHKPGRAGYTRFVQVGVE